MAGLTLSTRQRRWIGFLPVAVFLVSSAFLLSWWSALAASQRHALQDHLQLDARRVTTKIAERFDAYDEILRGAAGLFAASDQVTRDDFRRYVAALQLGRAYKGIQGVGFAVVVRPEQLDDHLRAVRAEGFPEYEVKPAGARALYTSIVYLEPFTGRNLRAFGYDMFSEAVRREAMESARDRWDVATSGKVTLVQETDRDVQGGILIYMPVHGREGEHGDEPARMAALLGWVYSPLRMNDLMEGILGELPVQFRMEILDGPGGRGAPLLYDSARGEPEPVALSYSMPLQVNQRTWTIRFSAGERYVQSARTRSPGVDLAVIAVIALLLTGLSAAAVQSFRARQRAVDLSHSLRESEARWRATFEGAPVGIFTVDAEDRFLHVNKRYCEITGYTPDELAGMGRTDIVHPEDRAVDAGAARRVRSREAETVSLERRGLRKDGTTFWAEITLSLEPATPGTAAGMIGVLEDVTARHDAEDKFREMAERSLAGILIVQEGRIAYANSLVAALAGVSPGEFVGKSADWARERIHPDDLPRVRAAAAEAGKEVAGTVRPVTYRVVLPGGIRKIEQLARPIQHLGRPAMLVFLLDITERERTEEELRKAQRLESLGIVAGGIAHDFNNLLTAVFGQVELAKGHVAGGSLAARELEVALSALERSRDLTRQLLTFASGGAPARKVLPVRKLLEDAVKLGLGGSSLRAHIDVEADLPPVEVDEGQMSQLLNNLLVNSRQATTEGGEVVVRARRRALREGEIPGLASGPHVEIAIQDRGHGIPPEVLPRIFDPFFTTRATGTGLGLATSYSIARRHGGHIGIESRVGEGTTVTVLLPASAGSPAEATPVPQAARPPRKLRVLLMDDEPMVLKVGVKHFVRMGLEVETAATGEEAIAKFQRARADRNPFDLAMLDLTVSGGMGGEQALARMREIDPGVVAIACSGYFDAAVMAAPGKFGFAGVLPKPYLGTDLEKVVATVVGKGR